MATKNSGTQINGAPKRGGFFSNRGKFLASTGAAAIVLMAGIYLVASHATGTTGPILGLAGKCLDNNYGKLKNGNTVNMWGCDNTNTQIWTLPGDGTIRFGSKASYCLDVKDSSKNAQAIVHLWSCVKGSQSQQWRIGSDRTIMNVNSRLCMEVKKGRTADATPVWMWACNGSEAQKWKVPTGSNPVPQPSPAPTPNPAPTPEPPAPTPTPTPPPTTSAGFCKTIPQTSAVQPNASNTGVPAGTQLSTSAPSGVTVTSDSWKVTVDGTVIDGKDINKSIDIEAKNVTIKNSRVNVPQGTWWAIYNEGNFPGVAILNSEITSSGGANTGITAGDNSTVCGVNAHGFENIGSIQGNNVIFQSNYFHQNIADPKSNDPHNDVLEVRVGTNIKLLSNVLKQTNADESWQHNTGAIYAAATYGNIDELTIDGNWLGGGTFSLYLTAVDLGTHPKMLDADVMNNKFYRNSYAYGPSAVEVTPRTWKSNVFEDNGQVVNP